VDTKEYLSQAYRIDQRINNKIEEAERLRSLAENVTTTFSETGSCGVFDPQSKENIITKLLDLNSEIQKEIEYLLDLKKNIREKIKTISKPEFRMILEMRYINFYSFEQIANEMHYNLHYIFNMHRKALNFIKIY